MRYFQNNLKLKKISKNAAGWAAVLPISFLLLSACAHQGEKSSSNEMEPMATAAEGIISMWSGPVKDRGSRFELNFNIKNMMTDQSVVVPVSEMTCRRGEMKGSLKPMAKTKLEHTIQLKPGQTRSLNLTCILDNPAGGDFTIKIGKVFGATASGTQATTVLAKELAWHYVDAGSVN